MNKNGLILLALLTGAGVWADGLNSFPLLKTATFASGNLGRQDVTTIRFDRQIYAVTDDLRSDLRVAGPDGKEIPFMVDRVRGEENALCREPVTATIQSLHKRDNALVLEVELPPEAVGLVDAVRICSPLANFEKKLRLEGLTGDGEWRTLIADGLLCDYSDYVPYRLDQLECATFRGRKFRLTVDNLTEDRPTPFYTLVQEREGGVDRKETIKTIRNKVNFRIDRVELMVWRPRTVDEKKAYALRTVAVTPQKNHTEILLESSREPLTAFQIQTATANYARRVTIAVPDVKPNEWRTIGGGQIAACDLPSFRRKDEPLTVPETRTAKYLITIDDGDNPPLADLRVTAWGPIYRAVMVGRQPLSLQVYYGGGHHPRPDYDVAAVLANLTIHAESRYGLGPEERNPNYVPVTVRDHSARLRLIFYLVLGLCVVILGSMVVRFTRHQPPDDGSL